jgi:hypothetical protein
MGFLFRDIEPNGLMESRIPLVIPNFDIRTAIDE